MESRDVVRKSGWVRRTLFSVAAGVAGISMVGAIAPHHDAAKPTSDPAAATVGVKVVGSTGGGTVQPQAISGIRW